MPDETIKKQDTLLSSLEFFAKTKILGRSSSRMYLPSPDSYSQNLSIVKNKDIIKKSPSFQLPEYSLYGVPIPKSDLFISCRVVRPLRYQAIRAEGLRTCASEPIIEQNAFNAIDSILDLPRIKKMSNAHRNNQRVSEKTDCMTCLAYCFPWIAKYIQQDKDFIDRDA